MITRGQARRLSYWGVNGVGKLLLNKNKKLKIKEEEKG